MNFVQHIQEIDKRVEERREKEQQISIFGMGEDSGGSGPGSMHESLTTTRYIGNNGPLIDQLNR